MFFVALAACACGGNNSVTTGLKMPEKAKILYAKAELKINDLENRVNQLDKGTDVKTIVSVLTDANSWIINLIPTE